MFKEGEKVYFIDTRDGIIQAAKFMENTEEGMWITISGHTVNTFVYKDTCAITVCRDSEQARDNLEAIKNNLRARLLKDNFYIRDIALRLEKTEGKLYAGIVGEILNNCNK
ncbi:hypothetical protein CLHUN_26370 [Ruminiclostridium hungatei]|uniref:Uncharacterized protein n=1 Tax=Ruminiclostridium hungatei TaxID=48256 RepID=A0A1V4SHZ4_RUMHU|nr:hypothetical protein [Ruminiclostridium hungatei]OPX43490.1 hypothetical protein CLHUN_26370 [Ruminiclostridium hungatei]